MAEPQAKTARHWGAHIRATLRLGVPLIGVQLAQMAIHVTDTLMLGWLGAEELAGGVLGTQLLFLCFITTMGFAQAVVPLAANAEGAGDVQGVRRATRMGLWVVLLVALLLTPLLWNAEPVLIALWQKPELAAIAGDYLQIAFAGLFFAAGVAVFRSHLAALERAGIILWATLSGVVLNAVLNWMLIFGNWGAPALGIEGAAIASVASVAITCLVLITYLLRKADLAKYALFQRFWRPDWGAVGEILRMGIAITATLLAEVGLFTASSLMIGQFGTVPLAAHGIALQITSVVFMVPLGLSSAASVRAGRALGRGDREGLAKAGATVLWMTVGFAVAAALFLWLVAPGLIGLFLDEATNADAAEIVAVGVPLLLVAAAFQLVDGLQVVAAGLLRGIKDVTVPMYQALVSYWGLGAPLAWILAFWAGMGPVGVWAGLAVGLALAALLLTLRFLGRDRYVLARLSA